MSDAEIQQAIRDAAQYAGTDNLRKEALEVLGEAQTLLGRVQQELKAAGKRMDKAEKKAVKNDSANLQKLITKIRVDKITESELQSLRQSKEQLEMSAAHLLNSYC